MSKGECNLKQSQPDDIEIKEGRVYLSTGGGKTQFAIQVAEKLAGKKSLS